jgi:hypothetical protein
MLKARAKSIAKERETLAEMRRLTLEGMEPQKAGKLKQAAAALRKAEKLKKRLKR